MYVFGLCKHKAKESKNITIIRENMSLYVIASYLLLVSVHWSLASDMAVWLRKTPLQIKSAPINVRKRSQNLFPPRNMLVTFKQLQQSLTCTSSLQSLCFSFVLFGKITCWLTDWEDTLVGADQSRASSSPLGLFLRGRAAACWAPHTIRQLQPPPLVSRWHGGPKAGTARRRWWRFEGEESGGAQESSLPTGASGPARSD